MVASPVITSCFLKISTSVKLSAIAFSLKAASSVYPRSILIPGLKFNSSSTSLFPKLIDPNICFPLLFPSNIFPKVTLLWSISKKPIPIIPSVNT